MGALFCAARSVLTFLTASTGEAAFTRMLMRGAIMGTMKALLVAARRARARARKKIEFMGTEGGGRGREGCEME